MRVRGLSKLLAEEGLVHTSHISMLRNTTLGVDAVHFFRESEVLLHDPLRQAISNQLVSEEGLREALPTALEGFKKNEIKTIFVFGGLSRPIATSPQTNDIDGCADTISDSGDKEGKKNSTVPSLR